MFPEPLLIQAQAVLDACRRGGVTLATAESCTGGLISGCLTAIAGSSDVVERGYVTYSNQAKMELLGVSAELLRERGAVSAEVARAMAEGALVRAGVGLTVAVTGIAGPGGGTPTKPVGLVFLATARRGGETRHEKHVFPGDRAAVRLATVARALELLAARAGGVA